MKNHNPNMCKGVQTSNYAGPMLEATLSVVSPSSGKPRRMTVTSRLNNPRKNQEAVLTELCARVKAQHPTAKLVSFERKEGRR